MRHLLTIGLVLASLGLVLLDAAAAEQQGNEQRSFVRTGLVRYDNGSITVSTDNNLSMGDDAGQVVREESIKIVGLYSREYPTIGRLLEDRTWVVQATVIAIQSISNDGHPVVIEMSIRPHEPPKQIPIPQG